ncbi:MAG TPA: SUKH-4 family immunity protein [Planctomycetota bacterium]
MEELRLPGWPGPTLFTPEPPSMERGAVVIGSIRETQGEPTAYAAFVVREDGQVWLYDRTGRDPDRYVNASLEIFLAGLARFVELWPALSTAETTELRDVFKAELLRVDPACLKPGSYWTTWMEPPGI